MTLIGEEPVCSVYRSPPKRWADMSMESTSEDEVTKAGAPLMEDSYHGEPIICMEVSRDGIIEKLGTAVSLSDGPKDFTSVITQFKGSTFVEDEVRAANKLQKARTWSSSDSTGLPSLQDMDEWDGDDDGTTPRGSWRSSPKQKGKGKGGKDRTRGKGKSKNKSDIDQAKPFQHQICFDWSRNSCGCSDPCPNGRKHACEHCGSTDHRGVDHDAAVGKVEGEDQEMDQGNGKVELQPPILQADVELNPTDFGFLLRGASPVWNLKTSSPMKVTKLDMTKLDDYDDVENEDSNSKHARLNTSSPRKFCQPCVSFNKVGEEQGAADKDQQGFSHQRCFEWSRKAGGCSFPCPNERLHVCEFCGSPDHRGIHHPGEKICVDGLNANGKRIRLSTTTKMQGSGVFTPRQPPTAGGFTPKQTPRRSCASKAA